MAPSQASAGKFAAKLSLLFLAFSPTIVASASSIDAAPPIEVPIAPGPVLVGGGEEGNSGAGRAHEFTLRHVLHHGTYKYPELLRRLDIHPDTLVATEETHQLQARPRYTVLSQSRGIQRLSDRSRYAIEAHLLSRRYGASTPHAVGAWVTEEVRQPNVTDKATVLNLAKISADAYIEVEHTEDWLDVGTPYNLTDDFGWKGDGLRGHIFADEDNSTIVIGLKGTSAAVFDGAETTTNDKVNDNLFFSCCCARVGYFWTTVCDCYSDTAYTCDGTCLSTALRAENRYYRAALQLYYNVTQMYPDSNVWVVGHSLGGSVSSLLGQTYGLPVVAFEAPGEALASERLGLPMPPEGTRQSPSIGVYHFGHTADPIYMGACNGPTSICSIGGYAMETKCHAGTECTYDVVSDRGWRMGLGYHRIQGVIKDVIEMYDDVPVCESDPECVDCFNWKFVSGNQTHTTSTSTTSPTTITTTSTTTCYTPGWWGCRDKTTTDTISTPTSTSATQTYTETCSTYGWFGNCLDPITNTTSVTTTSSAPATITKTAITTVVPTSTETCHHYGWFGGCVDPEKPTATARPTVTSAPRPTSTDSHPPGHWRCVRRALFGLGWCREWEFRAGSEAGEL